MLRYVNPVERSAMGLDDAGIDRLFREYVGPRLARVRRLGESGVELNAPTGNAIATADVVLPGGSRSTFGVYAELTPEGPVYDGLITQALLTAALVDHPRGDEADKGRYILNAVRAEMPDLRRLGVRGIQSGDKAESLDAFVDRLATGVAKRHPS